MEKVRYMISDAANIVNVESHVLRYWEDELELNIPRNEMGHRYYTKENIQEFQRIKELKEQGYQLKAIRMIVHNGPLDGLTAEGTTGQVQMSVEQPAETAAAAGTAQISGQQSSGQSVPGAMAAQIPEQQSGRQTVAGQAVGASASAAGQTVGASASTAGQAAGNSQQPVLSEGRNSGAIQVREDQQSILDNTDKMAQFTDLMTQIVGKAIAANNQELSQNISEEVGKQVIKEMNYLMREREEQEEERFRKLDAAIRGNLKKKEEGKRIWKRKKTSQTPCSL